jgi:hypothetical protein
MIGRNRADVWTINPNLQHAIKHVERPGESHEGVGRKKVLLSFINNHQREVLHESTSTYAYGPTGNA